MKILALTAGRPGNYTPITVSAGPTDGLKVLQTNAQGVIDASFLPANFGADVVGIVASEAIGAGMFVNIYANAGAANIRKAIATSDANRMSGYVQTAVASGATGSVYFDDNNTFQSGMTPGPQWLSDTVAGMTVSTPPTAAGTISQEVGVALSATVIHVSRGEAYTN